MFSVKCGCANGADPVPGRSGLDELLGRERWGAMIFIDIMILVALIKILLETDRPFVCAGIYAGMNFFFGLAGGFTLALFVGVGILFGMASLYFWLLSRLEGAGALWWLVAIGGPFVRVALTCAAVAATAG